MRSVSKLRLSYENVSQVVLVDGIMYVQDTCNIAYGGTN
jgi:hypothetical protein